MPQSWNQPAPLNWRHLALCAATATERRPSQSGANSECRAGSKWAATYCLAQEAGALPTELNGQTLFFQCFLQCFSDVFIVKIKIKNRGEILIFNLALGLSSCIRQLRQMCQVKFGQLNKFWKRHMKHLGPLSLGIYLPEVRHAYHHFRIVIFIPIY